MQPSERDIVIQSLQTNQQTYMVSQIWLTEARLENYIVYELIDFDDISYDDHADLLYELATQVVEHLQAKKFSEKEIHNILSNYRQLIAKSI